MWYKRLIKSCWSCSDQQLPVDFFIKYKYFICDVIAKTLIGTPEPLFTVSSTPTLVSDAEGCDTVELSAGVAQLNVGSSEVVDTSLSQHSVVLNLALPAREKYKIFQTFFV